jgi:hypothetical protein
MTWEKGGHLTHKYNWLDYDPIGVAAGDRAASTTSPEWSSPMLDDEKPVLADDVDSELFHRLRDPGLLKAFAALEEDLRIVVKQMGRYHDRHLD